MNAWPRIERLREIFKIVRTESIVLTEGRGETLNDIIDRIEKLTGTGIKASSSMQLRCSAALQHTREMEHLILDGMRLDRWITWQEEVVLVHMRIFCAEILSILTDTLDASRGIAVTEMLM